MLCNSIQSKPLPPFLRKAKDLYFGQNGILNPLLSTFVGFQLGETLVFDLEFN